MILSFQPANFRNLKNTQLDFNSKCNLFYGLNGSGKTSILEAIYYLGMGRSFRTHLVRRIMAHGEKIFSVFGKVDKESHIIPIGIERSLTEGRKIRIAGEDADSGADLAKILPIQLLNQNSYRLFEQGPKLRRQFIDWGVFHVEHSFLQLWRKTERIIEQRNAALRNNLNIDQIQLWDSELVTMANELHMHRSKYINELIPVIHEVLEKLLHKSEIDIAYRAGWDVDRDLKDILRENIESDLRFGYTKVGPHRADLIFKINGFPVQDVFSRGQQKLFIYSLQVAQGILFRNVTGNNSIYLIDDLAAELDFDKRKMLASMLVDLQAQLFVTSLDKTDLQKIFGSAGAKLFHVEHGNAC